MGGVIYNDSADKAARFIMNCNQKKIPLVFFEMFCATSAFLIFSSSITILNLNLYMSLTITALHIFFSTCARFRDRQAHGLFMMSVAYAMLGAIVASLIISSVNWNDSWKSVVGCFGLLQMAGTALTHSMYCGECPIAVAIQMRMLFSTLLSLSILGSIALA